MARGRRRPSRRLAGGAVGSAVNGPVEDLVGVRVRPGVDAQHRERSPDRLRFGPSGVFRSGGSDRIGGRLRARERDLLERGIAHLQRPSQTDVEQLRPGHLGARTLRHARGRAVLGFRLQKTSKVGRASETPHYWCCPPPRVVASPTVMRQLTEYCRSRLLTGRAAESSAEAGILMIAADPVPARPANITALRSQCVSPRTARAPR